MSKCCMEYQVISFGLMDDPDYVKRVPIWGCFGVNANLYLIWSCGASTNLNKYYWLVELSIDMINHSMGVYDSQLGAFKVLRVLR